MAKKHKEHHNGPLITVIVWVIVMVALAAACYFGGKMYYDQAVQQANDGLSEAQAAAKATNDKLMADYQQALAQFEAKNDDNGGGNLAWPTPKGQGWEVLNLDQYPLEEASVTAMTRAETMNNGMLLVNEFHSRPDDFDESEIVSIQNYSRAQGAQIRCADGKVRMYPVAIDALTEMLNAAKEQGYENYVPWEGYRTYDEQNELFQKAVTKYAERYSGDSLIERAKKDYNYPGTSEYNSGLFFRVKLYKAGDEAVNSKVFFESDEGIWMYEHSWEYGYIFRFPLVDYPIKGTEDKSYKTGNGSKLQGFRYVGKGNATAMHVLNMCMEEYIEYLMEHPHIAIYNDGQLKYEIYREYVGEEQSFNVTGCGASGVKQTTVSLDNMDHVISVFAY